jgi:hypothetical protein
VVRRLTDKPPELADYIVDYLNDLQIKEQIFRIGSEGFVKKGRGVVVVDLRRFNQHVVRFYYLSAGNTGSWQDAEMAEICQRYDPDSEVIVFLFYGSFSSQNYCYKIVASYL